MIVEGQWRAFRTGVRFPSGPRFLLGDMKNRIAVFTNGYSNEFIEHVLGGIRKKAREDDTDIFVFVTYCTVIDDELQNKCQLNIFHLPDPADYDGAIMLTNTYNFPDEQERVCARFQRAGVPMLSLEGHVPDMSSICSENYEGIYDLCVHLIEKHGVRKVAYVNGVKENAENTVRRQALTDALKKHDLELFCDVNGDFSPYSAYLQINRYLEEGHELPDAFVCANDLMAIGANRALAEHGYRVPDDVILTGFDAIAEGRYTFPILSSVSRGWDELGEKAYERLKYQIAHPEERFDDIIKSFFVPAESCGCKASREMSDYRFERIRNLYFDNLSISIMEVFFQRLQMALSNAERKEDFYENGLKTIRDLPEFGDDYCICTEPAFFELEDDSYPQRIRGYSSTMDILYERRNGKKLSLSSFSSKELYPGYEHKEGGSDLYILAPLNHHDYIIGYIAIKNSPKMLYNNNLRSFIMSLNAILFSMRRYIFAQKNNRELKKIYMTDVLTGFYNRTGCQSVLYEYINKRKEKGLRSVLVFADIDRMKTINDVHGHLNGDFAIKATADALQKFSPADWMFGRYGGDEFIAVGQCVSAESVPMELKAISTNMTEYFKSLSLSFILHASIGYTVIEPYDEGTIDDYIKKADESMYKEKERIHKLIDSGKPLD